ncbi:MAG: OmpA family protein [Polyangiaceae bacterium]|nr:OmpA family protein [Polyangiaceae bacterium]
MFQLRVVTPCSADWAAMKPVVFGKHCEQCNRRVVNFTNVTEGRAKGLVALLGDAGLCGRVAFAPDGSTVFADENAKVESNSSSVEKLPRWMSGSALQFAAVATLMLAASGCEPPLPPEPPPPPPPARSPVMAVASAESTLPPVSPPPVDSDGDQIIDSEDACPTQPGAAQSEPAKNGCPFVCSPFTMGDIVIVQNAMFAVNSTTIPKSSVVLLEEIAKILLEQPKLTRVEIQGHASRDEKNAQKLSEKRAEAVKTYLTQKGVGASRLVILGYGSTRPRVDEADPKNREINRRVEFKVVEEGKQSP